MYIFPLLLTTVTFLGGSTVVKADIDAGKTPPMEEWVNPGDMINYDTDSKVSFALMHNIILIQAKAMVAKHR